MLLDSVAPRCRAPFDRLSPHPELDPMPSSNARTRANRQNAKKSTGPRSAEGKARSRANSVKHGLSGEGVCLLPEDEAAVAERLAAWGASMRPADADQDYLVYRAVTCSVRLDRCLRAESAR